MKETFLTSERKFSSINVQKSVIKIEKILNEMRKSATMQKRV
jgi:hypothetical protein